MLTHLLQGLAPPILTAVVLWFFPVYFPLAFLEGCYFFSSLEVTSFYLDPTTWDSLAPSKRVVSSAITLSQSYWMYSNVFFFFFSSAILLFSASSFALASVSLLAFWAACFIQWASAAFSNWTRSRCSSSCYYCILQYCSSSILVLCWEILEGVGKDMIIQEKAKKLFSVYVLLTGTIMGFFG